MGRVRSSFGTAAAILALGAAGVIGTTAPAAADEIAASGTTASATAEVTGKILGGRIKNKSSSDKWLVVADDWNCGGSGEACGQKKRLYPGQDSKDYMNDADGLYVPNGCKGMFSSGAGMPVSYSSGWHKINDLVQGSVKINC